MESRLVSYPTRHRRGALRLGALSLAVATAGLIGLAGVDAAHAQIGAKPEQQITLKSLQFKPKKVTVKPGTKITFVWKESVAHNVVFDKNGPKSPTQNKGSWSPDASKLAKAGTYKYKCTLHPGMNGEITVK